MLGYDVVCLGVKADASDNQQLDCWSGGMAGQICRDTLMDSSKSGKLLTCALLQAATQVNDGAAHPLWVHPVADQDVEGLQVKEAALAVMQRLHALHISPHMSMLKSSGPTSCLTR